MAKKPPPIPATGVEEPSPFAATAAAPKSAAPAPVDSAALVAKLTQLTKDVQAADRERATADAQLAQARKDLAEIDGHLKAMGVEKPEQAHEALTRLEQELATLTAQFDTALTAERAVYQQIAAAAQ
jgi:septal ring factor EnvC (AmiA/AmiB activator)